MKHRKSLIKASLLSASVLAMASTVSAQDSATEDEVISVGIRQSLENALQEKRNADSLIEVILAEDIGKLPDQNLAEVLENVTGIQITRTAGVGTGVQIRGTNANRIEINGVSTVGSGAGRTGINFEDVNAAIIAGVEVIKAPEASTIEGSVGGTINLRTIRPLDLDGPLASVRIQGEQSNLSTQGIKPRVSGALGKKWENVSGQEFGIVLSGSYTEQESVSFRPRVDRDNIASAPGAAFPEYNGIQFLVQEQENFDYETINFAGTVEAKPTQNTRIYFDAVINSQERSQDSYRLQASGISNLRNFNAPTAFEEVDYGFGSRAIQQAALTGDLEPCIGTPGVAQTCNQSDGNLRMSSDTGSRVTDSEIFSIGGDWEGERITAKVQFATTNSSTENPNLSTTLNFLNPNAPLVTEVRFNDTSTRFRYGLTDAQRAAVEADFANAAAINDAIGVDALAAFGAGSGGLRSVTLLNDNATPFTYDLSDDTLSFGINFNSPFAPTQAQLLDPFNYVLDQVQVGRNTTDNKEDALRLDFSYDLTDTGFGDFITSVDAGYRYNKSSSTFDDIDDNIGGFSNLRDSPRGNLFSDLLVAGPDNYDDADGRSLFIQDFLLLDPDRSFTDPDGVIADLEAAILAHDPSGPDLLNLQADQNAFFDVEEKTNAFYAQANFEQGNLRGNLGFRYLETEVASTGFGPAQGGAARVLETNTASYDFFLPRANLIYTPSDEVVLRASYATDIRRPNYNDLGGFTFGTSENSAVRLGNPALVPEEVDSFDISGDWYFAPAAVFSIGYFNKKRSNIFGQDFEGALLVADPNTPGGLARETDPNCPGGGIFNPDVIPNVLGDPNEPGLCVDFTQPGNDPETTTQQGVEVAFQYDLSNHEDSMGNFAWASGFGLIANYTYQDFSGGSAVDETSGRGLTVLGPVSIPRGLLDFSKNAYNLTAFYEKYGLSARARYTWREGFRTNDFGGGANTSGSSTLSFPVHTLDRGQLNASINYDVTDNFNIGVEAVNLTKSRIIQKCVSESGTTCFVGYPDRRIVFGGSYTF
jgi:TonB-dependent receptor